MKRKGFTIIEVIISLVILVAIGLVMGVGLNKVFKQTTETEEKSIESKIISSADFYVANNPNIISELQDSKGYVMLSVGDLIDNGYLDGNIIDPDTGKPISPATPVKVSLDANGVLAFYYNGQAETEAYLEAKTIYLDYKNIKDFDCNATARADWGTSTFRAIEAKGEVFNPQPDYTVGESGIIKSVDCSLTNESQPGNYKITYIYQLEGNLATKTLIRSVVVATNPDDIVSISATISPNKVLINASLPVIIVTGKNRSGTNIGLNSSQYTIGSYSTSTAGTVNVEITKTEPNSDGSKPTTTVSFEVIDNLTEAVNDCTTKSDGCWYTGTQDKNYVSYSSKLWRIYKKNTDGSLNLILNSTTGTDYAFTSRTDAYTCNPSLCCNSLEAIDAAKAESKYWLSQDPNGLNTYLNSYLTTLSGYSTKIKRNIFDIRGYGQITVSITQKIGLLSYYEYVNITTCSTFTCSNNYLKISNSWGLSNYYRQKVQLSRSHNLAEGSYSHYKYPTYNESLYVGANTTNVNYIGGSYIMKVTTSDKGERVITSGLGTKLGVRPVIVLVSGIKISGGDGTVSNPFVIS